MKGMVVLLALMVLLPAVAAPRTLLRLDKSEEPLMGNQPARAGPDPYFMPENMTLEDDGFHEERWLHAETWYYEGLLDGNLSVVFIVTLLSLPDGRTGMALAGLYLYRQGRLVVREWLATPSFAASLDGPHITLDGTPVIDGYVNEEGDLVYDVGFEQNGISMALTFVNRTRGWMGDLGRGWWLAVPELQVTGAIILGDSTYAVRGTGYHDHNVFSLLNPLLERGYLDGKMASDSFSLVWGYIMESCRRTHRFAVLSEGGGYLGMGPEDIDISFSSYVYDNGSRIPTACTISIHDEAHHLAGELRMAATAMHHIRLPLLRYWRYHVEVTGWLHHPSRDETINERGIMEYMLY